MVQEYDSFGPFILFKKILTDELGNLYRAGEYDRGGVKRTVFLRVFDGPHIPNKDLINRLDTANRVASVLKAVNIAHNSQFQEHNETAAVSWDYIAAQPLGSIFNRVKQEGFPVPVDNALLIMEKLSLALSAGLTVEMDGAALAHGLLHPGLIVITTDGEGIVSGFGVADQLLNMLDEPSAAKALAPYLAPEILMTRTASKSGDVYSLGSILFQLLTSESLPAEADAREGILDNAELSYDGDPIPADIKALLSRALARRPEDRFSSSADFKKELDKLLYGGAYSPTTFNLALFMDRLFRDDIELEEKEKLREADVDVEPYIKPEPEPEPEPEELPPLDATAQGGGGAGKGLWIGLSLVLAAVVIVGAILGPKFLKPALPEAQPTPTAQELQAEEQARLDRMLALVDAEVSRQMEAKEEEIRQELKGRQEQIEKLQKQLNQAKDNSSAEAIKRKIAAAEEEKRQRQLELERERKEAEDAARQLAAEAAAKQVPTAVPEIPTPKMPEPTEKPQVAEVIPSPAIEETPKPQIPATPVPTTRDTPKTIKIVENMFIDRAEVDTPPEILKRQTPVFSRTAERAKVRGIAIVEVTVNARGKAENAKVLRIDENGFGVPESILEAARQSVFKPATKNGIKVKSNATLTFKFDFKKRR